MAKKKCDGAILYDKYRNLRAENARLREAIWEARRRMDGVLEDSPAFEASEILDRALERKVKP